MTCFNERYNDWRMNADPHTFIPWGVRDGEGFGEIASPGKLDKYCHNFIGMDGEIYTRGGCFFRPWVYKRKRTELLEHYISLVNKTVNITNVGSIQINAEAVSKNGGLIPIVSETAFFVNPNKSYIVESNIKLDIPEGYMGLILDRKGYHQQGLEVKGQVIHHTHKDVFNIYFHNTDPNRVVEIKIGEEIAQIAIIPLLTTFNCKVDFDCRVRG